MATEEEELESAAALPPEQLSEALSDEIAERWNPERILQLMAKRAGRGDTLDASLRARYERKLGVDLSHVRIYSGELAEEINKAHNADALTIGNTGMIIMGGSADKSMASAQGQALLAHELTHVAQAQRGMFRNSRFGDDSMPLATAENEAEAEEVQSQELSEQQGGGGEGEGGGGGEGEGGKEKTFQAVMERVVEMFGEAGRLMLVRGGSLARRP